MPAYVTSPRMRYREEELWFAASLYVGSWEEDFHELMLNDDLRMNAYERAIKARVRPGMAVADLGTGTGILAQWALEAGARVVYGIDVSAPILQRAVERIGAAGFSDRFQTFAALSYDVTLPERVDVLLSEILGNRADNEGMVAILNDARWRFLAEGGHMLPSRARSCLVPVAAAQAHAQVCSRQCQGLSDRYDLDELLKSVGLHSPFQLSFDVILPSATHLAAPLPVVDFAFAGEDPEDYRRELSFPVDRAGPFTGFKGYFTADLAPGVVLDISGDDIAGRKTSDSWKHSYLPVERPIDVRPGDVIELTYARARPAREDSPFRQYYSWTGVVRRDGRPLARFENQMT